MQTLIENSIFLILPALIALVAIVNGVRAFVGYRAVREDAQADFDYRQANAMIPDGLTREQFHRAFLRTHAPRAALYTALATGAVVVLTLPALRLMDLVMTLAWKLSGEDRTFEPTFLVYQFGIFFGVIALWALIGYIAARAYHRGSAVSFEEEIQRELGLL